MNEMGRDGGVTGQRDRWGDGTGRWDDGKLVGSAAVAGGEWTSDRRGPADGTATHTEQQKGGEAKGDKRQAAILRG